MGLRSQFQVKMKQREKRKNKRKKLSAKGKNPDEYYYNNYYIKLGAQS